MKGKREKQALENAAAERALLGAMLRNTTAFLEVKDRMPVAMFADERNQKVAGVMHRLIEESRSLNMAAVLGGMGFESDWSHEGYLAALAADACFPDAIDDTVRDLQTMQARREMIRFGENLIAEARESEDPVNGIEKAKADVAKIGDIFSEHVHHVSEIADGVVKRVNSAFQGNVVSGIPIGLKGVQDLTGPLLGGRLYVIAGGPGSGKSSISAGIAETISTPRFDQSGKDVSVPTFFHQIEMPAEEQVERMIAQRAKVQAEAIERAAIDNEEFDRILDCIGDIKALNLWIDSSTSPTVGRIAARVKRMRSQHNVGAVFIDNLLYVVASDPRMKEHEAVRVNLQGFKQIAKDEDIPVIVLAHLTKEYASAQSWKQVRRPRVSDLYGGAAVEQEADVILLLFREEYMLRRLEPLVAETEQEHVEWRNRLADCEGRAEVILGKRRGGKGFGIRRLYFDAQAMRFSDNAPSKLSNQGGLFKTAEDAPIPV